MGILAAWVEWSWIRTPGNFVLVLLFWLVAWLAIIVRFRRAQMSLYPKNPLYRRQRMLAFLVSPACAMRASDLLARDLMALVHPLAVARACCSPADFRQLASGMLLELMHPIDRGDGHEAAAVHQWFDERLLSAVTHLIHSSGEDLEGLIASPEPLGDDAHSYCPRCEMQFAKAAGECNVCGIALQSFDAAVA